MTTKDFRKSFNQKRWGNWRYSFRDDTLWWGENEEYYIYEFDTVNAALRWLAHMKDKKDIKEQEIKDLSQAFSELLKCLRLADAYSYTTYKNLGGFVKKAIQEGFSVCDSCDERFRCWTMITGKP
jgi:hypothetical protein